MNFCLKRKDYIYIHPNRKKGLGREREREKEAFATIHFLHISSRVSPLYLYLSIRTLKSKCSRVIRQFRLVIFLSKSFFIKLYIYIYIFFIITIEFKLMTLVL